MELKVVQHYLWYQNQGVAVGVLILNWWQKEPSTRTVVKGSKFNLQTIFWIQAGEF